VPTKEGGGVLKGKWYEPLGVALARRAVSPRSVSKDKKGHLPGHVVLTGKEEGKAKEEGIPQGEKDYTQKRRNLRGERPLLLRRGRTPNPCERGGVLCFYQEKEILFWRKESYSS